MPEHAQPVLTGPELKLVQSWVADCLNNTNTAATQDPGNHDICNRTRNTGFIPTRVLDLGVQGLQSDLRLTTRRELEGIGENITSPTYNNGEENGPEVEPFAYVTMTHRWTGNILKTTRASLPQHLAKISFDSLSTSFQEGVTIARQFGYRYLWIDSLCIIQDFADDWASESEIMCDIYMNAVMNIADATPLPLEQDKLLQTNQSSSQSWDPDEFHAGQLESRGWILQERVLAPATLYYRAPDQYDPHHPHMTSIAWICRAAFYRRGRFHRYPGWWTIEDPSLPKYKNSGAWDQLNQLEFWPRKGKSDLPQVTKDLVSRPPQSIANNISWLRKWQKLIGWYSRRELTIQSDRLPAISGLGRHFGQGAQLPYAAGLWLDWMKESLLWTAIQPVQRPTIYLAPSWSWASLLSQVRYKAYSYTEDSWGQFDPNVFPEYVSYDVQLASSNRFGALSPEGHNALHLKGRLVKVTLQSSLKEIQQFGYSPFAVNLGEETYNDGIVNLDFCWDMVPVLGRLYLLPVSFCEEHGYVGLLLELQDDGAHIYRRVGICDRGINSIKKWENTTPVLLTLV